MFKKRELILFTRDRFALSLLIIMAIGCVSLIVMTAFNIRVSDVQVPFRYSGYGFTDLYRDKWYALLSFGIFSLIILGVNGYLAIKLHNERRGIAIGILGISIVILTITIIIASAIFRLASLSL